jgi:hypothetical protein
MKRYKGARVDDLTAFAPWAILAGVALVLILRGCGA